MAVAKVPGSQNNLRPLQTWLRNLTGSQGVPLQPTAGQPRLQEREVDSTTLGEELPNDHLTDVKPLYTPARPQGYAWMHMRRRLHTHVESPGHRHSRWTGEPQSLSLHHFSSQVASIFYLCR